MTNAPVVDIVTNALEFSTGIGVDMSVSLLGFLIAGGVISPPKLALVSVAVEELASNGVCVIAAATTGEAAPLGIATGGGAFMAGKVVEVTLVFPITLPSCVAVVFGP
ncbi:uncharacterized protein PHALS_10010 [Plasmopara halstedii]|uniref:Uncharacterized protein n=1 Tax=Plasmopara halstedii TaxID=4781 RepID=A0A0P1AFM1_PLAHL|nr:uncharacterized protein PHALS_10010 [Plasmopara halstedii]CEG39774.1 hypothetical protein PHALS_10010 [Plasmopara halstedii]|eukprot:XP_024576143.1 hypothetical protein PHALS_10010 [Plasmopara halstedii]